MVYTRQNSLLVSQPDTQRGNVFIPRAEVYGVKMPIKPETLAIIWRKKKRRVPLALMLAKAECESSFCPFIFRYEIGQHLDRPNGWLSKAKGNDEFDATSGGLFQILGKNARAAGFKDWAHLQDLNAQVDAFDALMGQCLSIARRWTDKGEIDDVYQALNIYAYGPGEKTIYFKNALADKNFKAFKKYQAQYPNS